MCVAHPLGDKPLLPGLGNHSEMRNAVNVFDSQQLEIQTSKRMMRIGDGYRLALMMGSMRMLRSPAQTFC